MKKNEYFGYSRDGKVEIPPFGVVSKLRRAKSKAAALQKTEINKTRKTENKKNKIIK
ncbi:MAG: hypothetical protein LBT56_02665 [Prevotellaceae bacterium]|jgi:hypothetical protein|nr:hypothetical protein [Prevotellaceae bacterium]